MSNDSQSIGFKAISDQRSRVLILGSMPGEASLQAQQYYAHPRNAFWPIMGRMFGASYDLAYQERQRILRHHGVAVWDVLASCIRPGSLDANIRGESLQVNDFMGFFRDHPEITRVFFNGAKAAQLYRRLVLPVLPEHSDSGQQLPSTSPAHAAMPFEEKLQKWRQVADFIAADSLPGA